ncbi:TonB-dependent receptor domain-containing protein [Wolinella succinogenes]|uniref:TonB-dependent receptor domain-containing protein n=1 Tax=Wolinella succinogenes TaxID=844 RepID=UPI002FCC02A8
MGIERRGVSVALSLCLASGLAYAEDFAPSLKLNSVKVSAEAKEERGSPAVINAETIERKQAKDLKELFANEPSVDIGGGGRNAQRIYLRGIESNNLNITVDGAKQGRSLFQHRGDSFGIDPDLLKQVEVSTLSSADSGGGALGGSIAFETVDAQDLLEGNQKLGMMLRSGYASASDGYRGGTSVYGLLSDHLGILVDVSGQNEDDYRGGSGEDALYTATKDRNYFAKLSLLDLEGHTLKVGATHNKSSGHYVSGSTGSDMGAPSASQKADFQVLKRDTYTLDHRYNPENPYVDIQTKIYRNERHLENRTSLLDVTSQTTGGSLKNVMTLDSGIFQHRFTLGGDYEQEKGIVENSLYENEAKTTGLFLQGLTRVEALKLHYGLRWDDYKSDFGPKTLSGDELSPNFGAEYELLSGLALFSNYSESVRAGGIIPLQWMAGITQSANFNNGEAFKPEISKQKEGGIKYSTRGVFADNDRMKLSATLFKTTIENLIDYTRSGGPSGKITKIFNQEEDLISKGYELKASWEKEAWATSLGFIHVEMEEGGEPVVVSRRKAASMGDRFVWDVSYQMTPELLLGYTLHAVDKLDDVPALYRRAGYVTHDLELQWRPASIKGLTWSLAVHNLLDKSYYEQSSFESGDSIVEEAGRDVRLAVKYKF